jgi:hypothetical protein
MHPASKHRTAAPVAIAPVEVASVNFMLAWGVM